LSETVEACLAERMFYFHREIIEAMEALHLNASLLPSFQKPSVLWEIEFSAPITNVLDLSQTNASAVSVFPSLVLNPARDYQHLRDRRGNIQVAGYQGLRAPSARSTQGGHIVVLFNGQSNNVSRITPYSVEFGLITPAPNLTHFANHATEALAYTAGAVRMPSGGPGGTLYQNWTKVAFNH